MFTTIVQRITDSFQKKEFFFVYEDIKFHEVINETTNSFSVIKRTHNIFGKMDIILFTNIPTIGQAESFITLYKIAIDKKRNSGSILRKVI